MSRDTDAPRDLLFGLLALQTGLISQAQLVTAFHAWSRSETRPMPEVLAGQGAVDLDRRAFVEGLMAEHLRLHGGDPRGSLAALDVGRSTLEDLTRAGGPALGATLSHVGRSTDGGDDPDRADALSLGTESGDGRRFRVLRPHARGGLGAVFIALDGELNREVALKQILDHHADDPVSRQRFLLEAEITGGLEHPGIVPVYGLGTYADGRPYYAMRFIRGDSLKEAIAAFHAGLALRDDPGARSLALRELLRRFTDVCNAIDYAHGRGVLHRDIKPGNVIVGRHGETLVVDWGLAKAVGTTDPGAGTDERPLSPSSASGSAETLPGSALGTPSYMSPEQAAGDLARLGPRSDVYSLGATLYCLLTGKAPFEGGDVKATLHRVRTGNFPPPRSLDPAIDRALEAVCLKAMSVDPEGRYGSCRALADDVERWAADEPVSAWREPLVRRARRWGRRHRIGVAAAAAAVLVALAGTAAVLAVQTRANGRLKEANVALDASAARERQRFELAKDAISAYHTGVSEDFLLKEEKFKGLRTNLLRGAAGFYARLEALLKDEPDPRSRAALGKAYDELGSLTSRIASKGEALGVHGKALAVRRALSAGPGADDETKADVARSLIRIGTIRQANGDATGARESFDEAISVSARLTDGRDPRDTIRAVLAEGNFGLGLLLAETGRPAEGLASHRRAIAIRQALADGNPAVAHYRRDLANSHIEIANISSRTGDASGALESYRRALADLRDLVRDNPGVADYQNTLAASHHNLGNLLSQTGRPDEAMSSYRDSLKIFEALVRGSPAVTEYQVNLALNHNVIGYLFTRLGNPDEAMTSYRRALEIQEKVAAENPSITDLQRDLAGTHYNVGTLQRRTGKTAEALASYRRALAVQQALADANPTVPDFRYDVALSHHNVGIVLAQAGKPSEAIKEYRLALALRQRLADGNPAVTDYRRNLALSHNRIGLLLSETGKPAEALASYRRALEIQEALVDHNPDVTDFRRELSNSHSNIGTILSESGDPSAAFASFSQALGIRQGLADGSPSVAQFGTELAENLMALGRISRKAGRPGEASAFLRRAAAILDGLPAPESGDLYQRACCHALLAGAAADPGSGSPAAGGRAEAGAAMDGLRRAVAANRRDAVRMRTDSDLDPLRSRPDFRLLLLDLDMPANPFAGPD